MSLPVLALEVDPYSFACDGPLLGVPHGANVLTNLPFLLVGVWGLVRVVRSGGLAEERLVNWLGLWLSVTLLAFGSGAYHLWLTPDTLAADRGAIAGIVAFVGAEGLSVFLGIGPRAWISLLLLAGSEATVLAWVLGATSWIYGLVQAVGGLLLLALALRARRRGTIRPGVFRPLVTFLLLYGGAKLLEALDRPICDWTGLIGGHPWKHLVSAAALLVLFPWMALAARPVTPTPPDAIVR